MQVPNYFDVVQWVASHTNLLKNDYPKFTRVCALLIHQKDDRFGLWYKPSRPSGWDDDKLVFLYPNAVQFIDIIEASDSENRRISWQDDGKEYVDTSGWRVPPAETYEVINPVEPNPDSPPDNVPPVVVEVSAWEELFEHIHEIETLIYAVNVDNQKKIDGLRLDLDRLFVTLVDISNAINKPVNGGGISKIDLTLEIKKVLDRLDKADREYAWLKRRL
jgi:hypothetical protein